MCRGTLNAARELASVECDAIDDGSGGRYVFNRVNYCPNRCNSDPSGEGCEGCMMGGSGSF